MDSLLYNFLEAIGYGHRLHPVLTHLVIGPVIAAFLVSAFGWLFRKPQLHKTARHLTVVAFIFWFLTVGVGIIDWVHFYKATLVKEIIVKLIGAGVLLVILVVALIVNRKANDESKVPLVLYGLATACVVVLGYFGGEILFGSKDTSTKTETVVGDFKRVEKAGFVFEWRVRGQELDVRYSYPTTGWVGVGFGTAGTMVGSSIVIGYVKDGQVVLEDHFGNAEDEHASRQSLGEKTNLSNKTGALSNGVTTLGFTRPLQAGGKNDVTLVPGQTYSIIMARAESGTTDLQAYHGGSNRLSFTIQL